MGILPRARDRSFLCIVAAVIINLRRLRDENELTLDVGIAGLLVCHIRAHEGLDAWNDRLSNLPVDELHPPPRKLGREGLFAGSRAEHHLTLVPAGYPVQCVGEVGGGIVQGNLSLERPKELVLCLEASVGLVQDDCLHRAAHVRKIRPLHEALEARLKSSRWVGHDGK